MFLYMGMSSPVKFFSCWCLKVHSNSFSALCRCCGATLSVCVVVLKLSETRGFRSRLLRKWHVNVQCQKEPVELVRASDQDAMGHLTLVVYVQLIEDFLGYSLKVNSYEASFCISVATFLFLSQAPNIS